MELNSFEVENLHGKLNYKLQFVNNNLILIGENGAGKTTLMKMLFYLLSFDFTKLMAYSFSRIIIEINHNFFSFKKEEFSAFDLLNKREIRYLPENIKEKVKEIYSQNGFLEPQSLKRLCEKYGFPFDYFITSGLLTNQFSMQYGNLSKKLADIKEALSGVKILYLPTYRRIEQNLNIVLADKISSDELRRLTIRGGLKNVATDNEEIIEFGMNDVSNAIESTLSEIKEFFRSKLNNLTLDYLNDVVNRKYSLDDTKKIKRWSDSDFKKVLSRIDENVLPKETIEGLVESLASILQFESENNEHHTMVCHYLNLLLNAVSETEKKESSLTQFVTSCNKYLRNKIFIYDSKNFNLYIYSIPTESNIELYQLSSGEKQVISLLCKMYLCKSQQHIVFIDEPELSLSVQWQKNILVDVRNGAFCNGIFAVTHSPFIFDNLLDEYAHSLDEFKLRNK